MNVLNCTKCNGTTSSLHVSGEAQKHLSPVTMTTKQKETKSNVCMKKNKRETKIVRAPQHRLWFCLAIHSLK